MITHVLRVVAYVMAIFSVQVTSHFVVNAEHYSSGRSPARRTDLRTRAREPFHDNNLRAFERCSPSSSRPALAARETACTRLVASSLSRMRCT